MDGFHVLMYHEIIKKEDYIEDNNSKIVVRQNYEDILPKQLFVFLEEFEKQMEYVYTNGYTTLRLQQVADFYYKGKSLPEKSILLTFDDLYKSVLLYAYPILKKYNFNAVGFTVLDWLFEEEREYSNTQSVCLSKQELSTMRDVFEYANHSKGLHTRKDGLVALQETSKDEFVKDVMECNEFVDVKHAYAYPFGIYTDNTIEWLRSEGFLLAFTTVPGRNTCLTEPLKLHRDGVLLGFDMDKFKDIIK